MPSLYDIAPRLALARDQFLVESRRADVALRRYQARHLELERVVAHREMQLARATGCRRPKGTYIAARMIKLKEAQGALERLERRGP